MIACVILALTHTGLLLCVVYRVYSKECTASNSVDQLVDCEGGLFLL